MRGQIIGGQCAGQACLHAAGIVLGLGHSDVKSSLLISGIGCSAGLLIGVVDSQLVEGNLGKRAGSKMILRSLD